jgi:HK97 family phage portal protein
MGKATLQKIWEKYVWNKDSELRADTVNLENPAVPLDGFSLAQVMSGMRPSTSGILVNPENALRVSAVWRCVNIISGVISAMEVCPFYEDERGNRIKAKDHPTYQLFKRRPSRLTSKVVYWERAIIHLLLRGNHYAEIEYARNGVDIKAFNIILPTSIRNIHVYDGSLYYEVLGRDQAIPMDRMIHVPHLGEDPISGKSVITYAREDLGMEIARRDTGGRFWADGGDAKQVLVPKQKISPTQEAQLKDSFRSKKKEGGSIVAPFGVDVINVGMSPADQEFIMSGNFSIAAICRWFGVPLHKLSELERATFNNVESMAIEFLQDTIHPIIEKVENEYESKCFTLKSEQDMELEFNIDSYLRADSQSRAEFQRTLVQNGGMSPNEMAQKNGLPTVEGGDQRFIQQNMMPLNKVEEILLNKSKPQPPITKQRFSQQLKEQARQLVELAEAEYKINGNGH